MAALGLGMVELGLGLVPSAYGKALSRVELLAGAD